MEQYIPYIWLAIIVIAAVTEGLTAQLVSIWFVAGGVGALVAQLCGAELWLQIIVFFVVTALSLAVTRPFVKKITHFKKEETNAGRFIGKTGIVIVEINNSLAVGQVKVLGSVWTARSTDGSIIPLNATIKVKAIEGVKLIVELQN